MTLYQRIRFGLFIALHLAALQVLCFYAAHPETADVALTAMFGMVFAQVVLAGIWLASARQSLWQRMVGAGFCGTCSWLSLNSLNLWVGMSPYDGFRIFWMGAAEICGGVLLAWGFFAAAHTLFPWQIVLDDDEPRAAPAHRFHLRQLMMVMALSCLVLALARVVMPSRMEAPPRVEWTQMAIAHAMMAGFLICSLIAAIPALTVMRRAIEIDSAYAIVTAVVVQFFYAGCVALAEGVILACFVMGGGEYAALVLIALYEVNAIYLFVLTSSIGALQLFGWRFERRLTSVPASSFAPTSLPP